MTRDTGAREIGNLPRGGTGLLANFCDLAAPDRADYRPWLREDMIPPRQAIGFMCCGSFDLVAGDGPGFATLYETPSLGNLYDEAYQSLRRNRDQRDAAFHEKFRNPARYTLAWTGPELAAAGREPPDAFAEYILIDRIALAPDAVQDFNIWFACAYLPALAAMPGVLRVRRYLAMEGAPTHFILHDLADPALIEAAQWRDLRAGLPAGASGAYVRVLKVP